MSSKLKVSLIQTDLVWENPSANRIHFDSIINSISSDVDLIILPEMFTTGFTLNAADLAESMDGITVTWMQGLAALKKCALVGSIIISESENYYNRLLFVHPSGNIDFYDKRHTFTLAKEHEVFTAGTKRFIVNYKTWKICPLICYDLRFPVWARNTEAYDVLLYVASWPTVRQKAWTTLLQARAIENCCYSIGVNRVGVDGNAHQYSGGSAVYNSFGDTLLRFKESENAVYSVLLDKDELLATRNKFPFLNDRDTFKIV